MSPDQYDQDFVETGPGSSSFPVGTQDPCKVLVPITHWAAIVRIRENSYLPLLLFWFKAHSGSFELFN